MTALRDAGIEPGFRLVLDTGTFHGLDPAQRRAMGREMTSITEDDATVLLLAWKRGPRGPLPNGASIDDIKAAFPDWCVTEVGPTHVEAHKPVELLMKPDERWYRLRRET